MPLLDHFRPPLHPNHHWESFHSNWATRIADELNEHWLPPEFIAEESTHAGTALEIDVATFESSTPRPVVAPDGDRVATLAPPAWSPPAAFRTMPAVFPDSPAEAAGLRAGDVITVVDGQAVNASDDLAEHVLKRAPGDTVTLRVVRGGDARDVEVTLGVLPAQQN